MCKITKKKKKKKNPSKKIDCDSLPSWLRAQHTKSLEIAKFLNQISARSHASGRQQNFKHAAVQVLARVRRNLHRSMAVSFDDQ